MHPRHIAASLGLVALVAFALLRPDVPAAGSDCEILRAGWLREPVAALSSLVIVGAGWWAARRRPIAGSAVLLAGVASVAAHGTAHPTARALDGIVAALALASVLVSVVRSRPTIARLVVAAGVGSLAITTWALTRSGAAMCEVVGPWGHAAWHVLVGTGVVIVIGHHDARSPSHHES